MQGQRAGTRCGLRTDARRRAGLPEEPVLDPHTADLGAALQGVARVTLEHRGVASLPAVTAPAPILRHPWVIAGRRCGHWDKKTEEEVGLPRCQLHSEAPSASLSLTPPGPFAVPLPWSPSPPRSVTTCGNRATISVLTPITATPSATHSPSILVMGDRVQRSPCYDCRTQLSLI